MKNFFGFKVSAEFLRAIKNSSDELVLVTLFGAKLYGTADQNSDTDIKGIFLPNLKSVLLNTVPKSIHFRSKKEDWRKNSPKDVDIELYSLPYFLKLACNGETVALDVLHTNENFILYTSEIWNQIMARRKKFYSKSLNAFVGYARKQAAKYGIKGSRLQICEELIKLLKEHEDKTMSHIWGILPIGEHTSFVNDIHGVKMYQICGKKFQEFVTTNYVVTVLETFYNEYGHRAKLAKENNGIDWKAISHAMRACFQLEEIYTTENLIFPLKQADYLKQIKFGELDYSTVVAPHLDEYIDRIELLSKESKYRKKVKRGYWEDFLVSTYKRSIEECPNLYKKAWETEIEKEKLIAISDYPLSEGCCAD